MVDEKTRLIRARNSQRATFKRQGLSRKKKLEDTWRRPRGLQSKQRRLYKAKGRHPQPGYGSPKAVRFMHPSGYEDVLVHNTAELEGLNPEVQALRIAGTVGNKKRAEIQEKADGLGFKVLNPKEISAPLKDVEESVEEAEDDE